MELKNLKLGFVKMIKHKTKELSEVSSPALNTNNSKFELPADISDLEIEIKKGFEATNIPNDGFSIEDLLRIFDCLFGERNAYIVEDKIKAVKQVFSLDANNEN